MFFFRKLRFSRKTGRVAARASNFASLRRQSTAYSMLDVYVPRGGKTGNAKLEPVGLEGLLTGLTGQPSTDVEDIGHRRRGLEALHIAVHGRLGRKAIDTRDHSRASPRLRVERLGFPGGSNRVSELLVDLWVDSHTARQQAERRDHYTHAFSAHGLLLI